MIADVVNYVAQEGTTVAESHFFLWAFITEMIPAGFDPATHGVEIRTRPNWRAVVKFP